MAKSNSSYKVVDLFAGPGGLAEGFSSITDTSGKRIFDVVMSVEKETSAHRTLRLRAFTRQFARNSLPDDYYAFLRGNISIADLSEAHPKEWAAAENEAILATLGSEDGDRLVHDRVDDLLMASGKDAGRNFIVIGGPPCQAYSLIGRARNAGRKDYSPEEDDRHFLYREYIRILARLQPAAFVMENVKGMLSSSVGNRRVFEQILDDLRRPGRSGHEYTLLALAPEGPDNLYTPSTFEPRDFIVRAEEFGIPQARHRVFVLGIRNDVLTGSPERMTRTFLRHRGEFRTTSDVIGNLPRLRSGLSRNDEPEAWKQAIHSAIDRITGAMNSCHSTAAQEIVAGAEEVRSKLAEMAARPRGSTDQQFRASNDELEIFLRDPRLDHTINHETRGHMPDDLARYLFCALFARATKGQSPRASDFPLALAPAHANWKSGKFADRFKVQVPNRSSTTVTSHISKDGHYYIHPDPEQCRSLTVREAARLQTFPDNYMFLGNRTEQYVQVGNAVPPFLAKRIAEALLAILPRSDVGAVAPTESAIAHVTRCFTQRGRIDRDAPADDRYTSEVIASSLPSLPIRICW